MIYDTNVNFNRQFGKIDPTLFEDEATRKRSKGYRVLGVLPVMESAKEMTVGIQLLPWNVNQVDEARTIEFPNTIREGE